MGKYEELGTRVGKLVDLKNNAYGNSFDVCGEFLKLLWPNGCPPEQFGDMLAMARMFDKMKRIATDPTAFQEDPWSDLVGYSLLGLNRVASVKQKQEVIARVKDMENKYAKLAEQEKKNYDVQPNDNNSQYVDPFNNT